MTFETIFNNAVSRSLETIGPALTFALFAFFVSEMLVIPITAIFTLADDRGFWKEYKCIPNKRPPPALEQRAFQSLLWGRHFYKIIQEIVYYFLFRDMVWLGIPDWKSFLTRMFVVMILTDLWGYWYHRTVHTYPKLYRFLHKQHHEFTVSSVYASFYGGDVEDFLQSFIPVYLLPLLFNFTFFEFLVNRCLNEFFNLHEHLGYNLPWDPFNYWPWLSTAHHDFHHSKNVGNYSLTYFRVWDTVFGNTDAAWHKSLAKSTE
jgi:methylsterol monooxygenase